MHPLIVRCIGLTVVLCSEHAMAGYLDSFRDAATSSMRYTRAVAAPKLPCSAFRQRTDFEVTIISAELMPKAGNLPEHCKIHGVIRPEVQFWVYLPSTWNGRIYMAGHSGYAGHGPEDLQVFTVTIPAGIAHNFATVFTSTGHDKTYEPLGTFALNEIQKTLDYSYRAVHLTIHAAKELVREYYDQAASRSYFDGCSTGGRQALMEAQRFPDDFDGVVSGAPVNDQTNLHIWMAWVYQEMDKTRLPPSKVVELLAPKVYEKCDALDGARDGLIQDPQRCAFAPEKELPRCAGEERGDCFTPPQLDAITRIYSPVLSDGKEYFPAMPLGAEPVGPYEQRFAPKGPSGTGWYAYPGLIDEHGGLGAMVHFADTFFKYFAFAKDDPNYNWRQLSFSDDVKKMDRIRRMLDAVDPDLTAFRKRGGKIIQYHGWADTGPPASFSVKYYREVLDTLGPETPSFYRLFMVPGMFHCNGGFGSDVFDPMTALIEWVEEDKAPDRMTALRIKDGAIERSHPICPYPQIAKFKGAGDLKRAASFTCGAP